MLAESFGPPKKNLPKKGYNAIVAYETLNIDIPKRFFNIKEECTCGMKKRRAVLEYLPTMPVVANVHPAQ